MKIYLTTISENTAGIPFMLGEQGLSMLIDTGTSHILLDTGQSISVIHNIDALGIDTVKIDKIVLSHGHFDHTGGLRPLLLRMRRPVDVIAHPDVWAPKYNRYPDRPPRYIGIPYLQRELESLGARFVLEREPVNLGANVVTTGEVPMITDFETIDPHLYVKDGDGYQLDAVLDDRSVIINTKAGLVVVLGCAHRGMINTLLYAQQLTGVKKIHLVIGGSHLIGASEERLWRTIAALQEMEVERLGLCHCTSLPVAAILAREFGAGFFFNSTGNRIEIDC